MMSGSHFPLKKDTSREVIRINMDAFSASVEGRDHPELAGHPLITTRHPGDARGKGVVTTTNYIARQYGIHSAMGAQKVYELCPSTIFKLGNYQKYNEISQEARKIFRRHTDVVESVSTDEAYLDVIENKVNSKSVIRVAEMIRYDIWHELQLTCSVGASYDKLLAKLTSDFQKPKDLTTVLPEEAKGFLKTLPTEDFHGIGKKTVPKVYELGIFTGTDPCKQDEVALIRLFGKVSYSLCRKIRGIYGTPVQVIRDRKPVGKGHTYGTPSTTEE